MKTQDKTSIFDGLSQLMDDIDPKRIVPLIDRVLVRDLGEEEKTGSIVIPQTAAERGAGKNGNFRICEVVAVGPGDKWVEGKPDNQGTVKRRAVRVYKECDSCEGNGKRTMRSGGARIEMTGPSPHCDCLKCGGRGGDKVTGRLPVPVYPGQRVIVDRRKDLEIYIGGQRYSLVNCEQSVLAVIG